MSLAAAIAVACAIAVALDPSPPEAAAPPVPNARRSLSAVEAADDGAPPPGDGSVYPWARDRLRPLSAAPDPSRETPLFWHVPKSGGSTVKALYRCFGKRVAVKSQPGAIAEAARSGFVRSGRADVIFTSFPDVAAAEMFDSESRGRAMVIFRHPVERLLSKFFYLQIAKWEKTYRPEWSEMDPLTWAEVANKDNDAVVKRLAGKPQREEATRADLTSAKRTLRSRFLVGLTDRMEESVRRFNVVLGIQESDPGVGGCMRSYFSGQGRRTNSNPHPELKEDSPAWRLLAKKNAFDMQLYEYALELFDNQRELVVSLEKSMSTSVA